MGGQPPAATTASSPSPGSGGSGPEPFQAISTWPTVSLAEETRQLTAPGQMFETEAVALDGRSVRAWKTGPKALIDLLAAAVAFGSRTLLEGELKPLFPPAAARIEPAPGQPHRHD